MKDSKQGLELILRTAGVAFLYYAAARIGLAYAVVGSTVTLLWLPSGIALVAILGYGYRMAFGIALGAFFANAMTGLPMPLAASISGGNVLEAMLGAFLLQRLGRFQISLERVRDVFALIVLAAILSTMASACVGAATLTLGGIVPLDEYASVWLRWWLGDMMGVLVIAPPLLVWLNHPRPRLSTLQNVEAIGLLATLFVTCHLIFDTPELAPHGFYPASLAVIPFLIWGALRFDYWGATLVTLIVSLLAIRGTTHGTGPFAVSSFDTSLISWCIFVNLLAMTGLVLAVANENQRRALVALKNAHDELAKQKAAAERASLDKTRFLAAASHDLRQPMHAIVLYVDAMKSQLAGRDEALTLGKIEAAVAAMESLFNAILDVSKLDAGVIRLKISRVSVKSLLEGLYEEFHQEAKAKSLHLRLHFREASVTSDPVFLGRILRNLVANALRYTERGGVLIATRRHGEMIRFQVWDTGRGISPEHIDHIFQEFFQVANPHRDRALGFGLGLTIVDRLAHLLGHPLKVRSVLGKGTVFSLDVPVSQKAALQEKTSDAEWDEMVRLHGQVAVVDDDALALDSLASLLEGWGLQVIRAASGEELLAKLTVVPDILITDYWLGQGSGLDVAHNLRERYPGTEFRIVIVTGDTSEHGKRVLNESGYPFLLKPVRPAKLRALTAHLLRSVNDQPQTYDH